MDPLVTALVEDALIGPPTRIDIDVSMDVNLARDAPFPNPFDQRPPSGLALIAATTLLTRLRSGRITDDVDSNVLEAPGSGNMFGVLVVETPDGRLGFLRAFAGMLSGRWELAGFVPPLFDQAQRAQVEALGEADIKALSARIEVATNSMELIVARRSVEELDNRQNAEREALRLVHIENRRLRHAQRRARAPKELDTASTAAESAFLAELARQSGADKNARRRLAEHHTAQRRDLVASLEKLERELAALHRLHGFVSRRLLRQIHDTYRISNARGQTRPLRAVFGTRQPPLGAGDCAAPKLIGYAHAHSLRPIALAEFWFGAPPPSGGRLAGVYYPACRSRCTPLLPYMLDGLDVASFAPYSPPDTSHLDIRIVFQDDRIVVIDKPSGLLSVPSSNPAITDSATARLRCHIPSVAGPLFVHRLDMDTSGLLIAALDPASHAMLQRQFAQRRIEKRYVAWLDGEIAANEGTIDLAIAGDHDDRPRHIHDPIKGKPAITHWRVLERKDGCTRVAFHPITGRTHQLRIHAAHPAGLGTPIVGDNLYGRGGKRLMLHAEMVRLRHPTSNEFMTIESPAPF